MKNILKKYITIFMGTALAVSYISCDDEDGSLLRQKDLLGTDSITPVNIEEYFELEDRYNDLENVLGSLLITESEINEFKIGKIATVESLNSLKSTLTADESLFLTPFRVSAFGDVSLEDVIENNLVEEERLTEVFNEFVKKARESSLIDAARNFYNSRGITDDNTIAGLVDPDFPLTTAEVFSALDLLRTPDPITLFVSTGEEPDFSETTFASGSTTCIENLGLGLETNEEKLQFYLGNIVKGKFSIDNMPASVETYAGTTISFDTVDNTDEETGEVVSTDRAFNGRYRLNELVKNIDAQNNGFIHEIDFLIGDFTDDEVEKMIMESCAPPVMP